MKMAKAVGTTQPRAFLQTSKQKIKFSEEDNTKILSYFNESTGVPSLGECRDFLALYPTIKRTPKNIQDKVRNYG